MPRHEQVQKKPSTDTTRDGDVVVEELQSAPAPEALKKDLDALLDEVDSVLESNAEEFVAGFVQKGGQ